MGRLGAMKATAEISDALLGQAKPHARKLDKPLRFQSEEGLRRVLAESDNPVAFELEVRSVGRPRGRKPLESLSWQDLWDEIYG